MMATRNQPNGCYARQTPITPTASELEIIKDTVRKRYAARQNKNDVDVQRKTYNAAGNASRTPNTFLVYNEETFTDKNVRKIDGVKRKFTKNYSKYDINGRLTNSKTNNTMYTNKNSVITPSKLPGPVTSQHKASVNVEQETPRVYRPMSARPDSRWQRRDHDDADEAYSTDFDSDNDSELSKDIAISSPPIPNDRAAKSDQNVDMKSLPPRPKTGHGRRAPGESISPRPKSRTRNVENMRFNPNEKWSSPDDLKVSPKKVELNEHNNYPRDSHREDAGPPLKSSSREEIVHGIEHMHFGLEDIDLDVDPVEYFNYQYKFDTFGSGGNLSLLKNTETYLSGKENLSQNRNNQSGSHGNNQNERAMNFESNDRHYGNKALISRNSITNHSVTGFRYGKNMSSINSKYDALTGANVAKKRQGLLAQGMYTNAKVFTMGNTKEQIHMDFKEDPVAGNAIRKPKLKAVEPRAKRQ
ncbi:uncharacterized protein LOC128233909 [Mya arenaria]|uniref:uncharacterized protein LOC128233909 n=1 Tax=Mya arenaria TaxID=6604 RepID=UPI0022E01A51|nr:uncharacterized protein LOC128233909 [Mya arenaria]